MDVISIGANIKKYRTEKGIKQSELAEKTGVSANYIGILERGDKAPSLAMLVDIANTLGVTADMLLHGCSTGLTHSRKKNRIEYSL